jgi:hypothetical protein
MHFYEQHHQFYCGVDLHASWMYLCIQDDRGTVLLHKNLPTCPEAFQAAVGPYRQDLAVAAECMFSWYWISVRSDEHRLRPRPRPVHEGHPWR